MSDDHETPSPGIGRLHMIDEEEPRQHFAFLIWAMQTPSKRSYRRTGLATGYSKTQIRRLREGKRWDERVAVVGKNIAPRVAFAEYRLMYLKEMGMEPVRTVQPLMAFDPIKDPVIKAAKTLERAEATSEGGVRHEQEESLKKLEEAAQAAANAAGLGISAKERKEAIKQQKKIIKASIGYIVAQMKDKKVRANLTDLVKLLEAQQSVLGMDEAQDGSKVKESVRVRQARESGEDVLEAIGEDIHEQQAIFAILQQKRKQDEIHREEVKNLRELAEESTGGEVLRFPDQEA